MNDYIIRRARKSDIPFLAEGVIAGEKGVSDKCNYSTLFKMTIGICTQSRMIIFASKN